MIWQFLFCFHYRNIERTTCTQLFPNIFRPPKIKKIPPKRPAGPWALSRACPEPPGVLFRAQTVGIVAKIDDFSVGEKSCVLGGRRDSNKIETAISFWVQIIFGFSGPGTLRKYFIGRIRMTRTWSQFGGPNWCHVFVFFLSLQPFIIVFFWRGLS